MARDVQNFVYGHLPEAWHLDPGDTHPGHPLDIPLVYMVCNLRTKHRRRLIETKGEDGQNGDVMGGGQIESGKGWVGGNCIQ